MKTNIKQTSKIITALLIISAAIFINNQLVLDSDAAETTSITQEITVRVFDTKPFAAITNLSDGDYIIPNEITFEYEYSGAREVFFTLEYIAEDESTVLVSDWTDTNDEYNDKKPNLVKNSKTITLSEYGNYVIHFRATNGDIVTDYEDSVSFKHYSTKVDYIETDKDENPVFDIYYNTKAKRFEFNLFDKTGKPVFNSALVYNGLENPNFIIVEEDDTMLSDGVRRVRIAVKMPEEMKYGKYNITANALDDSGNYLGPSSSSDFNYEIPAPEEPDTPEVPDTGGHTSIHDVADSDFLITSLLAFFAISVFTLIYINRRRSE